MHFTEKDFDAMTPQEDPSLSGADTKPRPSDTSSRSMENGVTETALLHLGFPKCASTMLQDKLFANPDFGFHTPYGAQCIQLLHDLRVVDTFEFDRDLETIRGRYGPSGTRRVDVYSHEHLILDPYGEWSQIREGVRRLKALFEAPKILLVIREQKSAILSSYNEHLRRGRTTTFEAFVSRAERPVGFRPSVCRIHEFRYDALISYLQQSFGAANVCVLPFETITSGAFIPKLYAFLDRPVPAGALEAVAEKKRSSRKSDIVFLRHFNKLVVPGAANRGGIMRRALYGLNMSMSRMVPESVYKAQQARFRQIYDTQLGDFYQESNRRTSQLIGVDLAEFGYAL